MGAVCTVSTSTARASSRRFLPMCLRDSSPITALPSFTSAPEVRAGPFVRRHYPASPVLRPSPALSLVAPLSDGVRSHDLRQTRTSLTHYRSPSPHAVLTTPVDRDRCLLVENDCASPRWISSLPIQLPYSLPSSSDGFGIHDFTFEACSSFTNVTACKVAHPPVFIGQRHR